MEIASIPADQLTFARMREEVSLAVENEIQSHVTDYEISDEDYVSVAHQAWAKFYSSAIQYHQAGLKPMGLISDAGSGLVTILKKSGMSFVRPLDALEHLVLSEGDTAGRSADALFSDTSLLNDDLPLANDVVNLMKAVALVDSLVSGEHRENFSFSLRRLISPDQAARRIVKDILSGAAMETAADDRDEEDLDAYLVNPINFTQELSTRLQQVKDVAKALEVLLVILELDRGIVAYDANNSNDAMEEDVNNSRGSNHVSNDDIRNVFASPLGISVVTESLAQLSLIRFELARNLVVLQLLMLECGLSDSVSADTAELIHSTFLPRTVVMAHCYYVVVWLTETTATEPPANSL